jgi:hypothetical protein
MSEKEEWFELQGLGWRERSLSLDSHKSLGYDVDEAREIISQDRPDLRIILEREV